MINFKYAEQIGDQVILIPTEGDSFRLPLKDFKLCTFTNTESKKPESAYTCEVIYNELSICKWEVSKEEAVRLIFLLNEIKDASNKISGENITLAGHKVKSLFSKLFFGMSYILLAYVFLIGFSTILVDILTPTPADQQSITSNAPAAATSSLAQTEEDPVPTDAEYLEQIRALMEGTASLSAEQDGEPNFANSLLFKDRDLLSSTCP